MRSRGRLLITSFVLLIFSLFLTAYTSRNKQFASLGREVLAEIVYPVQFVFDSLSSGLETGFSFGGELLFARSENKRLNKEVLQLKRKLEDAAELRLENARLAELLNFTKPWNLEGLTARVIGGSASGWRREVVLSAGASAGVKQNMPVISSSGVVGKIVSVSPSSSVCLLMSDPVSGVGAMLQYSRAPGVVVGRGRDGLVEFRYLPREEKVTIGLKVITSGMDGVFPAGLPIGVVHEVSESSDSLFHDVLVKPTTELDRFEEAFVLTQMPSIELLEQAAGSTPGGRQ